MNSLHSLCVGWWETQSFGLATDTLITITISFKSDWEVYYRVLLLVCGLNGEIVHMGAYVFVSIWVNGGV